tara:strand:+ start:123 stop:440 length:318 start_codon:yes stop_codon:yes gene_type:complete
MSKKNWPEKVKEVMDALFENAAEAECDNSMYVEKDDENVWRILCNYERNNTILAYVKSEDKWYYQKMYGDFVQDDNLIWINDRLSQPMKNNHNEALGNANCWYTG